ncbi:protein ABHD15 isoform X1 [Corapipo altera]|uniref:protein ABHD15 isoform X1 n=1 Tax=Corapipo altera TaxID=415028 RepID=UPI000FD62F53|nr:protein ABHD15 isoform X1 [Corapipo altera]
MLFPEGLVAAATVLVVLGLLAWCLWEGRLEVPGDLAEEEEEEEGIPFMAEEGSGRCRLLCKPSALAQHLVRSLGRSASLWGGRWPWPRWPQLQMLQQLLQPPEPEPVVARELLQLSDAGLVALDWLVGPWGAVGGSGGVSSPVLLLIPNAAGKVTGGLLQLGLRALERGFIPVIFNRRGHNGCPLTTPRLQPFGDPGDLREAVTYLRCRHPTASLLAVSEGSGSGLLLAYLGESGSSSCLAAAACLSPIFRGRDWFEAAMPWLYEWPLLLHLKQGLSRALGGTMMSTHSWIGGCDCCPPFLRRLGPLLPNTARLEQPKDGRHTTLGQGLEQVAPPWAVLRPLWGQQGPAGGQMGAKKNAGTRGPWPKRWTWTGCWAAARCGSWRNPSSAGPGAAPRAGRSTGNATSPCATRTRRPCRCCACAAPTTPCAAPRPAACPWSSSAAAPTSSCC